MNDDRNADAQSKPTPGLAGTGSGGPMASILALMDDLVVTLDSVGRVIWVNAAFERVSGHALAQVRGRFVDDVTGLRVIDPALADRLGTALAAHEGFSAETDLTARNGARYRVGFDLRPLRGADGRPAGHLMLHKVVTEVRALEAALRSERYFLTRMIDTGVSAVAAFDAEGRCVFANSEARTILDRLTREERLCVSLWPMARIASDPNDALAAKPEDVDHYPEETPFTRVMRTNRAVHGLLVTLDFPDRPRQVFSVNAAPLHDAETAARVVMSLTDITVRFLAEEMRRKAADQAISDARHDALTGLPNDRYFAHELAQARAPFAVLVVDIDNFRSIRTVLGRSVGDALLCAVGQRLSQVLAARGLLARIEASEFAVRLDHATPAMVDALAQELHAALRRVFVLEQITVYAIASIGFSHNSVESAAHEGSANTLLRQAEVATFAAKSDGGNRRARYCPDMDARHSRRNAIVQGLRQGLRHDQFDLAFQPKFALSGMGREHFQPGRLIGAEALLRWTSPELGHVGPDEFIPVAEAAGMISEIDFHVMSIFARQLGHWRARFHAIPASINLSPRSFEDDTLAPRLLDLLAREGVAADTVTVEITETALISMSPAAIANIERFRRAGISLSIDDFGTGYSSFGYLQNLIVSEIKIDKSFVQVLPARIGDLASGDEAGTGTIIRTILALARSLGIHAVAEGVETAGQLAWLQREGCHAIQGYLGGRAVSPDLFERMHMRPAVELPAASRRISGQPAI